MAAANPGAPFEDGILVVDEAVDVAKAVAVRGGLPQGGGGGCGSLPRCQTREWWTNRLGRHALQGLGAEPETIRMICRTFYHDGNYSMIMLV